MELTEAKVNVLSIIFISLLLFFAFWFNSHPIQNTPGDIRFLNNDFKINFGLNKTAVMNQSQFYRLVTTGFVHDGFFSHLSSNIFSFLILGIILRKQVKPIPLILIIFGSLAIVSFLTLIYNPTLDNQLGSGFSAVPYTLLGLFIIALIYERIKLDKLDVLLILSVILLIVLTYMFSSLFLADLVLPIFILCLYSIQKFNKDIRTAFVSFIVTVLFIQSLSNMAHFFGLGVGLLVGQHLVIKNRMIGLQFKKKLHKGYEFA